MHNLLLITLTTLLTLTFSQSCLAQDIKTSDVPTEVKVAFDNESPDARRTDWYLSEDKYLVEFRRHGKDGKALYSADGTLLVLELEVLPDDLPIRSVNYLSLRFSTSSEILKSMLKKTAGFTMYEVEIAVDGEKKKLLFDEDGGFLMEVGVSEK